VEGADSDMANSGGDEPKEASKDKGNAARETSTVPSQSDFLDFAPHNLMLSVI
jgi:hypothetical protein